MNVKRIFLLLITAGIFILTASIFQKDTKAEIATTNDWVGLFVAGTSGTACTACPSPTYTTCDCKNGTVNGNTWVYTSSCIQTAGTVPKLSDPTGCNVIPNPLPPDGNYELRMYANNQETAAALIGVSVPLFVGPTPTPVPTPTPGSTTTPILCPAQSPNPRVQNGLISTPNISSNFGNPLGQCIISDQASFVPYKIPAFDNLKSTYFDQSKLGTSQKITLPGNQTQSSINLSTAEMVYWINKDQFTNGDLTISSNITVSNTGIIFVDGDLNITTNLTNTNNTTGLVFVVKGNVNIDPIVTRIDAVIISSGIIYTAGAGCSHSHLTPVPNNQQLIINGTLVALDANKDIEFCRQLADNSQPAERIYQQPKYLAILRNIYSDTIQKWSELASAPAPTSPPLLPDIALIATNQTTGTHPTTTWTQNCTGQNTMLIVTSAEWRVWDPAIDIDQIASISYGEVNLTKIGQAYNTSTGPLVTMWYQLAPATGTNNISANLTSGADVAFASSCWSGVLPIIPSVSTAFGSSTTPSVSVATSPGDVAVSGLAIFGGQTLSVTAPQANQIPPTFQRNAQVGHGYLPATGSTTSLPWSILNTETRWAEIGAVLRHL
ncbi:hypothetical protein M1437_01400 [Patescibacteria group bacterium]|nr:hypothetical protein [Patescibacteria group bacterium]